MVQVAPTYRLMSMADGLRTTYPIRPVAWRSSPAPTPALGYDTARVLAARGAHVVMAVRDTAKGEAAAARIRQLTRAPRSPCSKLDLGSLESVTQAAAEARRGLPADRPADQQRRGDVPAEADHRRRFRIAVRHQPSGPLRADRAAAGQPAAGATAPGWSWWPASRTTSGEDRLRRPAVGARRYDRVAAYGQSKLANLMFAYDLQRRLARREGENHCGGGASGRGGTPNWSGNSPAPACRV